MPSIEVLAYDRWPTISFYYKIDIFKIFSKAHNESLPQLLSNNIYTKRRNGTHYGVETVYQYQDSKLDL